MDGIDRFGFERSDQVLTSDAVFCLGSNSPTKLSSEPENEEILTKSIMDLESHGERHTFTFRSCSAKVLQSSKWFASSNTKEWKYLLQNVSGELRGGTDVAIMGPSGAGKSTLLNLLTLVPSTASIEGDIRLNGHLLTDSLFKRFCAYVPQEDYLWPFLTCREVIEFAADFCLELGAEERRNRIDNLISDLGLLSCQHTRCGNQFVQGLSGGQKRRLSLALALIKQPAVLFLDELTSGLDSYAAAEIMTVVRRVARAAGIVVICTIHQPSTRVYNEFDTVMLLSGGRVAYNGPAQRAVDYMAKATGRPPPDDLSPCEYMLEAINSDFGGPDKKAEVGRLLSAWAERPAPPPTIAQPRALPSGGGLDSDPPLHKQVALRRPGLRPRPGLRAAHAGANAAGLDPPAPAGPALLPRPDPVPGPGRHIHALLHLLRVGLRPGPRPHPGPGEIRGPEPSPCGGAARRRARLAVPADRRSPSGRTPRRRWAGADRVVSRTFSLAMARINLVGQQRPQSVSKCRALPFDHRSNALPFDRQRRVRARGSRDR